MHSDFPAYYNYAWSKLAFQDMQDKYEKMVVNRGAGGGTKLCKRPALTDEEHRFFETADKYWLQLETSAFLLELTADQNEYAYVQRMRRGERKRKPRERFKPY